ncbi:Os01g0547732 [Oryza sativa Japonica Group]|uniref:Os01g0547732 protein n=1 Tax=Oryza sativa subsp. japonica TaxID=39947 RepID=A0A0P0V3S6_ORYSJ|nr:Os01g0547732 [Oryza sativa Japonica Group]
MLHHHTSSADMWNPCTGVPRRPAFVRQRPRYSYRQLLLTPRSPPPPPATPLTPNRPPPPDAPLAPFRPPSIGRASRAKPASISAARASRAEPASAAIGCTSLRQTGLRPLHQTMPCQPKAVVCHALG